MRWLLPKSFLTLILIGFILVSVPLLYALVNALVEADRISKRGGDAALPGGQGDPHRSQRCL